jgi:hypothetical protein
VAFDRTAGAVVGESIMAKKGPGKNPRVTDLTAVAAEKYSTGKTFTDTAAS